MVIWKRALRASAKPIIRSQARRSLGCLRDIEVPASKRIAAAIEETIDNELSPAERIWVKSIEGLRSDLERSTTTVPFIDFGAGHTSDKRTAQQMSSGIVESKSIGQLCRASKDRFWSLLLFKLVRKLQPQTVIELGTCLGISAAYQSSAQKLNCSGQTITLEGAPALAELAQSHLRFLKLDNAQVIAGRFSDTLQPTLKTVETVDYAFIDGHHDEQATVAYYKILLPHLVDGAVVIFDDISWSSGMRRAWQRMEDDENISLSISLRTVGICVVTKGDNRKRHQLNMRLPT
jgi:predicted O-methyltransferase YrrM